MNKVLARGRASRIRTCRGLKSGLRLPCLRYIAYICRMCGRLVSAVGEMQYRNRKIIHDMNSCLYNTVRSLAAGLSAAAFVACGSADSAMEKDVAQYVNPFIGASTSTSAAGVYHGLGKTFPGAATPFGMVQVSPNTITGGDNGSGYSYEHTTIEGFAFTQMSGVGWYGDLGNLLVMPTTGPLRKIAGREDGSLDGYRSHYDKASERARAGYYGVHLTDYDIEAESSATPRCGILRFTFPESDTARIQIDLARRVGGTAERLKRNGTRCTGSLAWL